MNQETFVGVIQSNHDGSIEVVTVEAPDIDQGADILLAYVHDGSCAYDAVDIHGIKAKLDAEFVQGLVMEGEEHNVQAIATSPSPTNSSSDFRPAFLRMTMADSYK